MYNRTIILAGRRETGKDTAAEILCRHFGAVSYAFADGFKEFLFLAFGMSAVTVWGPSHLREEIDTRYAHRDAWLLPERMICGTPGEDWLAGLLDGNSERAYVAHCALRAWFLHEREYALANGGLLPRRIFQQIGTDFGRRYLGVNVWRDAGLREVERRRVVAGAPLGVIRDGRFEDEVVGGRQLGARALWLRDPAFTCAKATETDLHPSECGLDHLTVADVDALIWNDKAAGLDDLETQLLRVARLWYPDAPLLTAAPEAA